MASVEEIFCFVEDRCQFSKDNGRKIGVQVGAIAEYFGIWQGEVTKALSELVSSGRLIASGSRPILYKLPDKTEGTVNNGNCEVRGNKKDSGNKNGDNGSKVDGTPYFSKIIGYNGSLKYQTQVASAAVSYPPNGIHTLIIGKTGVGKSLLASEMGRYLSGIRAAKVPFVSFNCAEYSDNPQLLLAQLFGHVKGAFTGADKDKAGLIELSNGGILFLDELHRLPPTGQEMLFTLIDEGYYRRLGDIDIRTAKIMIVGATTENPSNFLLNTFKRRIPFIIQIPELCERPINERLNIIAHFFYEEAKSLGTSIHVSFQALKLLAFFKGKNNIGDLRNEIRVACAQSHWHYIQRKEKSDTPIGIDVYDFSRNLSIQYIHDDRAETYFVAVGLNKGLNISCDRSPVFTGDLHKCPVSFDFQNFIEQKMHDYRGLGKGVEEAEQLLVGDLEKRYKQASAGSIENEAGSSYMLYGSIAPIVWQTANELIGFAQTEFDRSYDQGMISSVAYYLQQLMSYASAGRIVFSPNSFGNASELPNEKSFVKKMSPIIKNHLGIELMDGEIILLAMLLAHTPAGQFRPSVNLLLCGYANCASSIAAFANRMLNTNYVRALDIPDNLDSATLLAKIIRALDDSLQDTIILCGFNVHSVILRALANSSLFYIRILPILEPVIVLEATRMLLLTELGIDRISSELIRNFRECVNKTTTECCTTIHPVTSEDAMDTRDVVITYCITGFGSARTVREIILRDIAIASSVDILPLGIKDNIYSIAHRLGRRLKLVIGIMNPEIAGIPYVSIDRLIYSGGVRDLLRNNGINLPLDSGIRIDDCSNMPLDAQLNSIKEYMYYFAPSLDIEKTDKGARHIIENLVKLYQTPFSPDLTVRIYIHCTTMFERVSTTEAIPMPLDGYTAIERDTELFYRLKSILAAGANMLGLYLTDAEVYYLMITLPVFSG